MKRVVWIILMITVLIVLLSACSRKDTREPLLYNGRMRYAGTTLDRGISSGYIWIDTEPGVCYIESNTGVFTVLVDRDGKPFIANGWRDWGGEE